MRTLVRSAGVAALAAALFAAALPASPAEDTAPLKTPQWSFTGVMGGFDTAALQRGFQVFDNVCAACHSLSFVAYRNLVDIGLPEAKAKEVAAAKMVTDGPNDQGEMFQRPAILADRFVPPFANENAARYAMNGAYPPDLSLIVKAREGGPDYVYSLLTGFADAPHDVTLAAGMNYNPYFPGHQIAMPPPLAEGVLDYADGTKATVDQMAKDVTQFLEWAAEPKLGERKRMGLGVMLFLLVLTGMFYAVKRAVWRDVH